MKLSTHSKIMAAVQGGIFLAVGTGFGAALVFPNFAVDGKIGALAAFCYLALAAFFAAVIAAFGGVNTARKDLLDGKIELTDADRERGAKLSPVRRPMWLGFLPGVIVQSAAVAAVAAGLCFGVFRGGVPAVAFYVLCAALVCPGAAFAAWLHSGRELARFVAHPADQPEPFTLWPYSFLDHLLGNMLVNYGINSLLAYAVFHQGPKHPEALAAITPVLIDNLVMSIAIAILVPIGVEMQAGSDVRDRRVLPPNRHTNLQPNLIVRNLIYIAVSLAPFLVFALTLQVLEPSGIPVFTLMTVKGLLSVIQAALVAHLAAFFAAARAGENQT